MVLPSGQVLAHTLLKLAHALGFNLSFILANVKRHLTTYLALFFPSIFGNYFIYPLFM